MKVGQVRPDDWLNVGGKEKGVTPVLGDWVDEERGGRCGREGGGQGQEAGMKWSFRAASSFLHAADKPGDVEALGVQVLAEGVRPDTTSGMRRGSRMELWGTTLINKWIEEEEPAKKTEKELSERWGDTRGGSLKAQGMRGDNRRERDWP